MMVKFEVSIPNLVSKLGVHADVIDSPIEPDDNMRSPGREWAYYAVGHDALRNVVLSMAAAGLEDAQNILDFPSGFGRVTRYLRAAFPDANIDVGDIWEKAVGHCAKTYGAQKIEARSDFNAIEAGQYDLIFCGSLITHLPEESARQLLLFFTRHLRPGGILVASCCGRKNLQHEIKNFNEAVFVARSNLEKLADIYASGKYAFAEYPGQVGYGRSFTPVSWFHDFVTEHPNIIISGFAERGWDDNQDVITMKHVS